jgi:GNAT superfamily N-acetyltransferase
MPKTGGDLELRAATLDDAVIVADLDAIRSPDDPRDPVMLRFFWESNPADEPVMRLVAERGGEALAFVAAGHAPWVTASTRYGWTRPLLHPSLWSEDRYGQLVTEAESWLARESGEVAVASVREDFSNILEFLERRGYREVRRGKVWELDLVAERERLLAAAADARANITVQGVRLMTLDIDDDPDRLDKLYEMTNEAEQDIPTTVPMRRMPYQEWRRLWLDMPSTRLDRFWIARDGNEIVGVSVIGYPPVRGVPWTSFTGTSRKVRGRGIARALKYATVAQAIELGVRRIRTNNDGQNAPILHLNAEMGYTPIPSTIEMHYRLGS